MPKELTPEQLKQILTKSDLAKLNLTEEQLCEFKNELLTTIAAYEERAPFETFKASTRDEIRKAFDNAEVLVKSIDRFLSNDYFLKANVDDQSAPNERVLSDTIHQLVIFAEEMLKAEERIEGLKGVPFNNLEDDPLTSLFFYLLVLRAKYLKKEPPTSIGQTVLTGHHRDYLVFCASLCRPTPEKPLVDRAFKRAIYWTQTFKEDDFWKDDFA
jgi:hypothetical protein